MRGRKNVWRCGEHRQMLVARAREVIRVLGKKNVKKMIYRGDWTWAIRLCSLGQIKREKKIETRENEGDEMWAWLRFGFGLAISNYK